MAMQDNESLSGVFVYRTPATIRIGLAVACKFFLLFLFAPYVYVTIAVIRGAALSSFGLSTPGVAVLALSAFVLLRWGWREFVRERAFGIRLGEDSVETISAFERRGFRYDQVEFINAQNTRAIAILATKGKATISLSTTDAAQCAQALRARCLNAVFVDTTETGFVPSESCRPLRNRQMLERWRYLTSFDSALLGTVWLLLGYVAISMLSTAKFNFWTVWTIGGIIGLGFPLHIWDSFKQFKQGIETRNARKAMMQQGIQDQ